MLRSIGGFVAGNYELVVWLIAGGVVTLVMVLQYAMWLVWAAFALTMFGAVIYVYYHVLEPPEEPELRV